MEDYQSPSISAIGGEDEIQPSSIVAVALAAVVIFGAVVATLVLAVETWVVGGDPAC